MAVSPIPESFATIAIGPDQSVHVSYRGDQNSSSWSDEPHNALREGLERLFDGWELANLSSLASQPGDDGWAQIDAHYAELSERFGYRVVPQEDVADVAARAHAGLTQQELAQRMGTTQSVIARLEGGKSRPSTVALRCRSRSLPPWSPSNSKANWHPAGLELRILINTLVSRAFPVAKAENPLISKSNSPM